jgi:hypothetical protein
LLNNINKVTPNQTVLLVKLDEQKNKIYQLEEKNGLAHNQIANLK